MGASNTDAMIFKILETNTGGQKWDEGKTPVYSTPFFCRSGAIAYVDALSPTIISTTIILEEYFMRHISHQWARVGETAEETLRRCGEPLQFKDGIYTNTIKRSYEKGGILTEATFFVDKSGKSMVGELYYPRLMIRRHGDEAIILQLLEANAGGGKWTVISKDSKRKFQNRKLHRQGVTATVDAMASLRLNPSGALTITLDEYADFVASETKRIEAEKANRVGKQLNDF